MPDIAFAKPALPKSGALALLIHEGEKPSGLWAQLDEATGGAIARAFEVAEFKGAKGKTCAILAPGAGLSRVLAVGLGKPAEVTQKILEEAGGAIAANLSRETSVAVGNAARATIGRGRAGCGAAELSFRSLSDERKARGQAEAVQADDADG
jgi:leucyl aminopeptidase